MKNKSSADSFDVLYTCLKCTGGLLIIATAYNAHMSGFQFLLLSLGVVLIVSGRHASPY